MVLVKNDFINFLLYINYDKKHTKPLLLSTLSCIDDKTKVYCK